ncbi:HXXXD-type acyl-transferase family protein [Actinidia rufa]|uniref:HXXXD-type acyl-transferase family protein n=1 Tax=Actinidia rufa TaxID=165716 RepID=A0A7J0G0J0_9ERIC|nr:HXXXD-type acyl-transferase family protein [Actinidia rufa]
MLCSNATCVSPWPGSCTSHKGSFGQGIGSLLSSCWAAERVEAMVSFRLRASGEGVWFVEATADCSLDVVNDLEDALSIPYDKLLPDRPLQSQGEDPLLLMQVTQFACDGFVIGLTFCHTICDGMGAAQFLHAMSELARGVDHLTVAPVWHRDFLPPSPQDHQECPTELGAGRPPAAAPPIMPSYRLEHANIDISLEQINELKQKFPRVHSQDLLCL